MAPNAQTPAEKLAAIFTGLKNRNADVRIQNAKELRRFVSFQIEHETSMFVLTYYSICRF
jgi:FKBP12-rapamycin complex-associated protein